MCRAIVSGISVYLWATLILAFMSACQPTQRDLPATTGKPHVQQASLELSGIPPASVAVSTHYYFKPRTNAPGDAGLEFELINAPNWLRIDINTGVVTGVPEPELAGFQYQDIHVSASNGIQSASLGPFGISITATAGGQVLLSWIPPDSNQDGSAIGDLRNYYVHYGFERDRFVYQKSVDAGVTSTTITNLSPNNYWFAMSSVNGSGVEGELSTAAQVTIN